MAGRRWDKVAKVISKAQLSLLDMMTTTTTNNLTPTQEEQITNELGLPPLRQVNTQLIAGIPTSHNIASPLLATHHKLLNTHRRYSDYKTATKDYYPQLMAKHAANVGAKPPTYSNH